MTVRLLALAVSAWAAVVLVEQPRAAAQPRIRLVQNQVPAPPTTSTTSTNSTSTGTSSSTGRTPVTLQQMTPVSTQQPCCDGAGTMTLPALTAPSVGFDPYNCNPVGQPVCPPAVVPVYPQPYATPPAAPQTYIPQTYTPPAYTPPTPTHRFRVFGDFLLLQPSGSAVTNVALPIDGAIMPPPAVPIPLGPILFTDPDYEPGFRVGFGYQPTAMGEWAAIFTYLETRAEGSVSVDPAGTARLRPLVFHPGTAAAGTNFQNVTANSGLDLILGEIEYRGVIPNLSGPYQTVRFIVGGRYANLEQAFAAQFANGNPTAMVSGVEFEGAGPKFGLDLERKAPSSGFLVYGRAAASFVAGQVSAAFAQRNNAGTVVAAAAWDDDRIVPILDLEAGLGWKSSNERFLLSAGYLVSAWFNIVGSEAFIHAVQTTNYNDIQDTLLFDGPVARAEFRF